MKTKNIIPITLFSLMALATSCSPAGEAPEPGFHAEPAVEAIIGRARIASAASLRGVPKPSLRGTKQSSTMPQGTGLLQASPRNDGAPVYKTAFDDDDKITFHYYHGKQAVSTDVTYGELGSSTLLVNADTARIVATYTPAVPDDNGITTYPDKLEAISKAGNGIDYNTDPATITLDFHHTQTLLVIGSIESTETGKLALKEGEPVDISITEAGGDIKTIRTGEAQGVICPPGATINSITFTLTNGMQFTAIPQGEPGTGTLQPGMRHTINITVSGKTATINTPTTGDITPWGDEQTVNVVPPGYDRAIYSKEDLIAFRDATNDPENTTARREKVIQMADITLDAKWEQSIADNGNNGQFRGEYNGNGYTITGLTMDRTDGGRAALFGFVSGGTLTGIHLRQVNLTGDYAAPLVAEASGATISLCSATGEVTGTNAAGGLVASLQRGSTLLRSRATCTVTGDGVAGGLVGGSNINSTILGCMAGGSVGGTATYMGALAGQNISGSKIYFSYSTATGIDLVGNNEEGNLLNPTIFCCYGKTEVYDSAGILRTGTTDLDNPGDIVRGGGFIVGGTRYSGSSIWTDGNFPTLVYSYGGIKQ